MNKNKTQNSLELLYEGFKTSQESQTHALRLMERNFIGEIRPFVPVLEKELNVKIYTNKYGMFKVKKDGINFLLSAREFSILMTNLLQVDKNGSTT